MYLTLRTWNTLYNYRVHICDASTQDILGNESNWNMHIDTAQVSARQNIPYLRGHESTRSGTSLTQVHTSLELIAFLGRESEYRSLFGEGEAVLLPVHWAHLKWPQLLQVGSLAVKAVVLYGYGHSDLHCT